MKRDGQREDGLLEKSKLICLKDVRELFLLLRALEGFYIKQTL